jgi:hypothetical protein
MTRIKLLDELHEVISSMNDDELAQLVETLAPTTELAPLYLHRYNLRWFLSSVQLGQPLPAGCIEYFHEGSRTLFASSPTYFASADDAVAAAKSVGFKVMG